MRKVHNTMTDQLIAPHGGELVVNMADEVERAELLERAFPANVVGGQVGHKVSPEPKGSRSGLPQLVLESRQLADLEMLAVGAYSPLTGFMCRADYLSVVNDMHLLNGLSWSIPITLSIHSEQATGLKEGSQVALVDAQRSLHAVMTIEEMFPYDKQLEASKVYRTLDDLHPGVN